MTATMTGGEALRASANQEAFRRLNESEPVLVDILPAIDALPGMTRETILTSGPALPWKDYIGGQRDAIIGGALFEGLAPDRAGAERRLAAGEIKVDGCHAHGCVGSLAGIYTASMPVFVVRNDTFGNIGHCNFYEGTNPRRLNYGVYDEGVRERLLYVNNASLRIVYESAICAFCIQKKLIMSSLFDNYTITEDNYFVRLLDR